MGFGANGRFYFTKELKEIFRKKKGFGANVGFGCTKVGINQCFSLVWQRIGSAIFWGGSVSAEASVVVLNI